MLKAAAKPPDGPLNPHQRQPQQQKRNKIGNHERPAAVIRGNARKPKEIAQTDGAARHGQNHPQFASPMFTTHTIASYQYN